MRSSQRSNTPKESTQVTGHYRNWRIALPTDGAIRELKADAEASRVSVLVQSRVVVVEHVVLLIN